MKQKKCLYWTVEVTLLAVVELLGFTFLNTEYLFKWIAHHWIFYIILAGITLSLLFFNKQILSIFMTAGITVGIFIGNYFGAYLQELDKRRTMERMTTKEVYIHTHHPGFEIWMENIIMAVIVGAILQNVIKKKYKCK